MVRSVENRPLQALFRMLMRVHASYVAESEIADVTDRSFYGIALPQKTPNRFSFGGGLDNHQLATALRAFDGGRQQIMLRSAPHSK